MNEPEVTSATGASFSDGSKSFAGAWNPAGRHLGYIPFDVFLRSRGGNSGGFERIPLDVPPGNIEARVTVTSYEHAVDLRLGPDNSVCGAGYFTNIEYPTDGSPPQLTVQGSLMFVARPIPDLICFITVKGRVDFYEV